MILSTLLIAIISFEGCYTSRAVARGPVPRVVVVEQRPLYSYRPYYRPAPPVIIKTYPNRGGRYHRYRY
jgi:hypothetical protein